MEGGRDDVHIGQMRAALVWIVVDEHIAGRDIGKCPHDCAHRVGHRAEMYRQVGPLRDHVAADVEDAARVVAGHFQQRRIGGLGEDDLHLLGRAGQCVLHDLEAGRISLQPLHVIPLSREAGEAGRGCSQPPHPLPNPPPLRGRGGLPCHPITPSTTRQPNISKFIHLRAPAWRHDDGRVHRLDDRRTGDLVSRRQTITPMHRASA